MQKNTNLFKKNLQKDSEFTNKIFQSIKHPHIFIKTITIRIITEVFNANKKIFNFDDQNEANNFLMSLIDENYNNNNDNNKLNTLQIILDNFKFIILCKDFNLKENLIESTLEISSYLNYLLLNLDMRNKKDNAKFNNNKIKDNKNKNKDNNKFNNDNNIEYGLYSYEFICRLYGDSKKYLANKNYTNLYVKRILIIIEKIFNFSDNYFKNNDINFENKNEAFDIENFKGKDIEILLEPVLSLLYRLISNNLVDEDIKIYSEKVFIFIILFIYYIYINFI
jgi:hypothetical protein